MYCLRSGIAGFKPTERLKKYINCMSCKPILWVALLLTTVPKLETSACSKVKWSDFSGLGSPNTWRDVLGPELATKHHLDWRYPSIKVLVQGPNPKAATLHKTTVPYTVLYHR